MNFLNPTVKCLLAHFPFGLVAVKAARNRIDDRVTGVRINAVNPGVNVFTVVFWTAIRAQKTLRVAWRTTAVKTVHLCDEPKLLLGQIKPETTFSGASHIAAKTRVETSLSEGFSANISERFHPFTTAAIRVCEVGNRFIAAVTLAAIESCAVAIFATTASNFLHNRQASFAKTDWLWFWCWHEA